jgi:tRNA A-37 threonylcarbamoyl transferase component Bud32
MNESQKVKRFDGASAEHLWGTVVSGARQLITAAGLVSLDMLDTRAYREHVSQQNRLRIAWVFIVTAVFYPGFAVLDAVVFPHLIGTFLSIRLAVTATILGSCGMAWLRPRGRLADLAVLVASTLSQVGILALVFLSGGFASGYWVGLLIIYAGYVGFSPHGGAVAALFFAAVQLVYFAGCWWIGGPGAPGAKAVESMFFLGAGGAFLALIAQFNELNRRQVFQAQLRIAEQDLEIEHARAQRAEAIERSKAGRLAGRTLNSRYRLGEVLGRGGAGEVYLAHDLTSNEACAVKVLHPELVEKDDAIHRFLREAQNASAVASAHVVKVLSTGHDPHAGHFLVMEYIAGEDLGALFNRRGSLPWAELRPIIAQIAEVLETIHAAGIVHRDLKPKNVLIVGAPASSTGPSPGSFSGSPAFAKLIDFGIAKILAPREDTATLTAPVAILGSVGYMAPEQALGLSASVGPATDVFSLAAIVYRGLTGRLAFPGESLMNFCLRVCFQPFEPVESVVREIHPDVTLALALALAKDPIERTVKPLALVQLLEDAMRGRLDEALRRRARTLYQPQAAGPAGQETLVAFASDTAAARS